MFTKTTANIAELNQEVDNRALKTTENLASQEAPLDSSNSNI